MGIQELLDQDFPNRRQLAWFEPEMGLVGVFDFYSQADPRLSHVQAWAEKPLETLTLCTNQSLRV